MGVRERQIMEEIENDAIRVTLYEALKHLIVGGNALLYLPAEGGVRTYPLHRFVVRRDPTGTVMEIITLDDVHPDNLPEGMGDRIVNKGPGPQVDEKTVELYTYLRRDKDGKKYEVWQEAGGIEIPGSRGSFPIDASPFIPLRFTKVDGEDYGRGYVEEYYGDLLSLENLTQAIVEGSAAAAKLLFLVDPGGSTEERDVAEAPNTAVRSGRADDVTVVQANKFADFQVALHTMTQIQERLSWAFLLNTTAQRDAERVTAEEIRFVASELEDALGGVYSILSLELQLPIINRVIARMERQGRLQKLPKGSVSTQIVTGLEALGRGHDLNKLNLFVQQIAQLGPEILMQYINPSDFITRLATSIGIDAKGLVLSEQEIQQRQQMAMMQQMMQQAAGPLAQEGAGAMRDQMQPNGE